MQFSLIALFAAITSVAMASPMSLHNIRACDAARCAVALGPAAVSCVNAAVKEGRDPSTDASCFSSALNDGVNTPTACAGCAAVAASGITAAVPAVTSVAGNVFGDVKSAIAGIF